MAKAVWEWHPRVPVGPYDVLLTTDLRGIDEGCRVDILPDNLDSRFQTRWLELPAIFRVALPTLIPVAASTTSHPRPDRPQIQLYIPSDRTVLQHAGIPVRREAKCPNPHCHSPKLPELGPGPCGTPGWWLHCRDCGADWPADKGHDDG